MYFTIGNYYIKFYNAVIIPLELFQFPKYNYYIFFCVDR